MEVTKNKNLSDIWLHYVWPCSRIQGSLLASVGWEKPGTRPNSSSLGPFDSCTSADSRNEHSEKNILCSKSVIH